MAGKAVITKTSRVRDMVKVCSIIAATAVVIGLAVPNVASAAGQVISLGDADGDSKAQVDGGKVRVGDGVGDLTVDGLVTARPQDTTQYVSGSADTSTQYYCTPVLVPPTGQALILQTLLISVYRDPSPSDSDWVGFYTDSTCNTGYVTHHAPAATGLVPVNFEPGFGIPAGRGLYMVLTGDVAAGATATGYLVPASGVRS